MRQLFIKVVSRWETMLVLLILATVAWSTTLSPHFLTPDNLLRQTRAIVVIGLLALGLTLVVIAAEIDLSGEAILSVCAVTLGLLFEAGISVWVAALMSVVLGAVLGLVNGVLVGILNLPSLAVTLGTLIGYGGLAFVVLEQRPISGFPPSFTQLGMGTVGTTALQYSFLILLAFVVLVGAVLHLSTYGRRLYAIGHNKVAARLSGVPVTKMRVQVFVISGAFAGLGAVMLAARFGSVRADSGEGLILDVVAAVLLGGVSIFGGVGTIGGVFLALLLIGLLRNGMSLANIGGETQSIIIGVLLVAAVLIPLAVKKMTERLEASSTDAGSTGGDPTADPDQVEATQGAS
jgi:rhamnose transport system permease protein